MAWEKLPTNYTDVSWQGLKKYYQIENEDGTVSFQDVTVYENKENSFFGAKDANDMNEAMNNIMSVGVRGANLLHNWYFYNPVNRRQAQNYNSGMVYGVDCIDRWKLAYASLTMDSGTPVLQNLDTTMSRNSLFQLVDHPSKYRGQKLTCSVLCENVTGSLAVSVYANNGLSASSDRISSGGVASVTFTVPDEDVTEFRVHFNLSEGGSCTPVAIKLELGSTQTLAHEDENGNWLLYDIPDYAEQYAICAQYGINGGFIDRIESTEYPGCYYRIIDGVTEWINPPMVSGTEYRLAKKLNNKPVYAMSISNTGALDNTKGGHINVSLSVSGAEIDRFVQLDIFLRDGSIYPVPYLDINGNLKLTYRMYGSRTLNLYSQVDGLGGCTASIYAEYIKK